MLSAAILAELRDAVGADGLIIERNQLQTYECDGLAVLRSLPAAVVLASLHRPVASDRTHLRPASHTLCRPRRRHRACRGERCPMTGAS